jgi:hypothetical protein
LVILAGNGPGQGDTVGNFHPDDFRDIHSAGKNIAHEKNL